MIILSRERGTKIVILGDGTVSGEGYNKDTNVFQSLEALCLIKLYFLLVLWNRHYITLHENLLTSLNKYLLLIPFAVLSLFVNKFKEIIRSLFMKTCEYITF